MNICLFVCVVVHVGVLILDFIARELTLSVLNILFILSPYFMLRYKLSADLENTFILICF